MTFDASARRIHPLVAGAAVAVVVASLVGIAAMTGLMPSALSGARPETPRIREAGAPVPPSAYCPDCGTVESVRAVEVRGSASGLGAVAGGLTGAVIGNQFGRGDGNTVMTVLGAAGGALAGNEIEKNLKKRYVYRVTVRLQDGSVRTLTYSSPPAFSVGDKVRWVDGRLERA